MAILWCIYLMVIRPCSHMAYKLVATYMRCLQFRVPMHTTNHKHLINCNPRSIPPSNHTQRSFAFRLHAWLCGIIMYGNQVGWSHGYGIVELHGDLLMCMDVWRNGYDSCLVILGQCCKYGSASRFLRDYFSTTGI